MRQKNDHIRNWKALKKNQEQRVNKKEKLPESGKWIEERESDRGFVKHIMASRAATTKKMKGIMNSEAPLGKSRVFSRKFLLSRKPNANEKIILFPGK